MSACTKSTPPCPCATPHTSQLKNFLTFSALAGSDLNSTHLQALLSSSLSSSPWNPEVWCKWSPCTSQHCSDLSNQTMLMSQRGFQILPLTSTSPTETHSSWTSLSRWSSLRGFPEHPGHSGHTIEDPGVSWGLWAPSGHHQGYLQKWPHLVCRLAERLTSTLEQQKSAESFNPRRKTPPLMTTAATKG